MFKTKFLILSLVLIFCAGCSTIRVSQDYDPDADFTGLSTFAWKSDKQPETGDILLDDPLIDQRIRMAVEQTLEVNGYTKTDRDSADFLVAYELGIRQKIKSDNMSSGIIVGTGHRGTFGSIGIGTGGEVETYDQGLLFIDVLDPKSGKLLWRGKGTDIVREHPDQEETTRQINEIVEKILAQFPP